MAEPVVIATWPFGKLAAETAHQAPREGRPGARCRARRCPGRRGRLLDPHLGRVRQPAGPPRPAHARRLRDGRQDARLRRGRRASSTSSIPRRSPAGDGEDAARPARRRGGQVVRPAAGLPARSALYRRRRSRSGSTSTRTSRRRARRTPKATRSRSRIPPISTCHRRAQPRHGDRAGAGQEGEPRRRLHDERAGLQIAGPRRRFAAHRRGALCRRRGRRGRRHRRRRGGHPHRREPLHRRADARREESRRKRANWPASGSTPRPADAASIRHRSPSWPWTRRGTSAPLAPRRRTSSTPSAAATRSRWCRRRRSRRTCDAVRGTSHKPEAPARG